MDGHILLKMEGIAKEYPGSLVLDNVNFELKRGEVHVLCGENGAGKSTLMRILAGLIQPTKGSIYIDGEKAVFSTPKEAEAKGVAIIHQELSLCPTISVAENIFLGKEKTKHRFFLDKKAMHKECEALFEKIKCYIDPSDNLAMLTTADQQLVQIAKALSLNTKILVMDEPFSSLSDDEAAVLFDIMDSLRSHGVGIIYIDHRIDNFYKIGDRVTVLRDGKYVGVKEIAATGKDEIIKMMVGRELNDIYPKYNKVQDEIMFSVKNMESDYVKDITFDVKKGEIFGLGGLVGAGRTEILRAIFGIDAKSGTIEINGLCVEIGKPWDAIKERIVYIPEDRKRQGLFLGRSVRFNSSIIFIDKLAKYFHINRKKERASVNKEVESLKIKVASIGDLVSNLSGGNQQKVVLSKWLMMENINLLILDEPTRGIDIGAKYEIYKLINDLACCGIAVILVTSDLPELLNLTDRVAVVRNGMISGRLNRDELSQESVMALCV
ncbi:putative ribose/galactose/methyl galactoside import ATP-binding protein 1 [Synergistales bacterium]|nr:putative ribose/galactose/methyl galactoside import ATP-binding protein 1 [Synergistales bacterium]